MRHLAYNVRYSVVLSNSSLLTITLYYSVITLGYNDAKCLSLLQNFKRQFDCICYHIYAEYLHLYTRKNPRFLTYIYVATILCVVVSYGKRSNISYAECFVLSH